MTDALATLRAGCQKGEMPLFDELLRTGVQRLTDAVTEPPFIDLWDEEACLDALAALQEALWPGSVFTLENTMKSRVAHYQIDLFFPYGLRWKEIAYEGGWQVIAEGGLCPNFACAWLDAILAGLQQEKDDG